MFTMGVLNSKGGVGKTLFATLLSVRAARADQRVGLVDLDPQQGSIRWFGHRQENGKAGGELIAIVAESGAEDALQAAKQAGCVIAIFDGAPGSLESTEEAIEAIDFVVIPLKASDHDVSSTEYTVSACVDFKTPYLLVLNDVSTSKSGLARATEIKDALTKAGQPVANTIIHHRVGYVDAVNTGQSAAELKGQAQAKAEFEALYEEIVLAGGFAGDGKGPDKKATRRKP